jgi:hypothetical protein
MFGGEVTLARGKLFLFCLFVVFKKIWVVVELFFFVIVSACSLLHYFSLLQVCFLHFFFLFLQVLCLHLFYYHFKIPICKFTSFGQRFDIAFVIG